MHSSYRFFYNSRSLCAVSYVLISPMPEAADPEARESERAAGPLAPDEGSNDS